MFDKIFVFALFSNVLVHQVLSGVGPSALWPSTKVTQITTTTPKSSFVGKFASDLANKTINKISDKVADRAAEAAVDAAVAATVYKIMKKPPRGG